MAIKKTLTIAIPAYNEAQNIKKLIDSLNKQNIGQVTLDKILVISDGSEDTTVKVVSDCIATNPKVKVIDHKTRIGKAKRLNEVMNEYESDILVLLDADILLEDVFFIEKIAEPVVNDRADLTSTSQEEIVPPTLFAKILDSGTQLKNKMYEEINNGNNIYTCHGHSRALSKRFYKHLRIAKGIGEDAFSYLYCIKAGYKYEYVKSTVAKYILPSNLADHKKQSTRFFNSKKVMEKFFGTDFVKKQYDIPLEILVKTMLKELLKKPLDISLYVVLVIIMQVSAKFSKVKDKWDMATSTKIFQP